jgi:hypothetical protein
VRLVSRRNPSQPYLGESQALHPPPEAWGSPPTLQQEHEETMSIKFHVDMQVEDLRKWIKEEKITAVDLYSSLRKNPDLLKFSGYKLPEDALNDCLRDIEKNIQKWEKKNVD